MEPDSSSIFSINNQATFTEKALEIFNYQYKSVDVYREFCHHLKISPEKVDAVAKIPFLPISFFKSRTVLAANHSAQTIFSSSGTTGQQTSKHLVADLGIYEKSFTQAFEAFYGPVTDYCVLALLPAYLERKGSSLVYMAQSLITQSGHAQSGFYLHDYQALKQQLKQLQQQGQKTLLIGVSFALLDLAAQIDFPLQNTIVMETGGMKGRRKELIRAELHQILSKGLGCPNIHSEYGMTELLSQAYATDQGIFECPPWMQVLIRDTEDPLSLLPPGKTGGLNIIDLANLHSCAFIATQDLGKAYPNGSFEVLGRFDHADVRGCNLMVL